MSLKQLLLFLFLVLCLAIGLFFWGTHRVHLHPMTYDDSLRAILDGDTDILNHSRIPDSTLQDPY